MSEHMPLYRFSREEARSHDVIKEWRDSYHENCNCAFAIGESITANYQDNRLGDCLTPVVERFGIDRVNWVLANTIQQADYDGRYSRQNKEWAKSFYIPKDENNCYFCVKSHPCLVDGMADMARKYWSDLGLFDRTHCEDEQDYTGKLLVMKAETLRRFIDLIPKDFNLSNVLLTVVYTKKGCAIKYIPITFRPRQGGVNSINMKKIFKIGRQALSDFREINRAL